VPDLIEIHAGINPGVPPGEHTLTYYIVNTAGTKWMKAVNVTVR